VEIFGDSKILIL